MTDAGTDWTVRQRAPRWISAWAPHARRVPLKSQNPAATRSGSGSNRWKRWSSFLTKFVARDLLCLCSFADLRFYDLAVLRPCGSTTLRFCRLAVLRPCGSTTLRFYDLAVLQRFDFGMSGSNRGDRQVDAGFHVPGVQSLKSVADLRSARHNIGAVGETHCGQSGWHTRKA